MTFHIRVDGGARIDGEPARDETVVALREQGATFEAIANELGLASRANAHQHVSKYRDQREDAEWLLEHGPDDEQLG